jgi:hypothetical protein
MKSLDTNILIYAANSDDSALAFDFTGLDPATFSGPTSSVPEPPPVAMMALELGLVAVIVCRRQRSGPKRKSSPFIVS